MLKSKWIASVLALALIVTPVQGVTAAEVVTKNEVTASTEEVRTTSDGNAVMAVTQGTDEGSDAADAVKGKLDAPTGVTWELPNGFNIYPTWNAVESKKDSGVYYDMEIFCDGESYMTFESTTNTQFYFSAAEFRKSGTYTFKVRAKYQDNTTYPDTAYASDYSVSEPLTLQKLTTPTAAWGEGWQIALDESLDEGHVGY